MHQIPVGELPLVVNYRSAAALAADELRHRIWSGQLEATARLNIDDLAKEMGLSSTPVREALKSLEREGLVSIAPRSGVRVRQITVDELVEVYAVKEALEPLIVRWAMIRGTPDQLKELVDTARVLTECAREQRLDDYLAVVQGRWRLLLEMAGSEVLANVFEAIEGRARLFRYRNLARPGRMEQSASDHRQIARAIASKDLDRAQAIVASSVRSSARSVLSLVLSNQDGRTDGGSGASAESLIQKYLVCPAGDSSVRARETKKRVGAPGRSKSAKDTPTAGITG